ncbi:hypothetical protein KJ815_01670, partial [bacterium]|nr:hypothetical protein [bacterium]
MRNSSNDVQPGERRTVSPSCASSRARDTAEVRLGTNSIGNRLGSAGREHTFGNLIDLRNRFYHTQLGRFLQRDPAGFVDGVNLYQ